jgi:transcription elongation factor Elf1
LARATARSNLRASPWLRTIKCPACGDEHVRPCTRVDEGGREWIDNSCETCGHTLSLEEISRNMVNSTASPMSQAMEDTR